jgi:hypothetical protein
MINTRSIAYGVLVGTALMFAAMVLTSCGDNWIIPEGSSTDQPSGPTGPTNPTDGGGNTDGGACDAGTPPVVDAGTPDGGSCHTSCPVCHKCDDRDDDDGRTCRGDHDDDDHKSCRKDGKWKECCKPGHGWGDTNHCHKHWKDY